MKVRVKLQRRSQVVELEGREPPEVKLEELRSAVATAFGLESQSLQLSLNKTDILEGNEQDLTAFGIVSGDLLHIIGPDLQQEDPPRDEQVRRQPLGTHTSNGDNRPPVDVPSDVSMATVDSSPSRTGQDRPPARNMSALSQQENLSSDDEERQINRCLVEPLVVRESTATQVPALLEQVYTSTQCGSNTDALWVVTHTLMLESGFSPLQVTDITELPGSWKQSGFYRCSYQMAFPGGLTGHCSVVGVVLGGSVIIHGLSGQEDSSFKTEHVQLKSSDYIKALSHNVPDVYVALDRLSRLVKDTICLPLENELATAAGVPGGQGFTSLPYEVKVRILSFLDARTVCRVRQTRSDLASVGRDKGLWRHIYLRDFKKPDISSFNRDWYQLYRDKHKMRLEERRRRQQRFPHLFGLLPDHPRSFHPFHPHMIGGDYDLRPEFAAGGIPNPMGSGRRPGPVLPNIGIPSPLDHDPLRSTILDQDPLHSRGFPGRSGGGNLPGLPFPGGRSGGSRGGLFRSPFM